MKRSDDRESFEAKRSFAEEGSKKEVPSLKRYPKQAPETLRPGYSWIQALRNEHPGWDFVAVEDTPWTALAKPLNEARVALLTTAGVCLEGQKPFTTGSGVLSETLRRQRFRGRGDFSFREIPRDAPPEDLRITHPYYDHTDADQDINCVFPLERLLELESENFIGEAAANHYSLMGYIPEAPLLLETIRKDLLSSLERQNVDAVLLTPGDPLSHQTAGLLQREIERAGIPTVAVTVCRDITAFLRVPRAAAVRFPLGNTFGHPLDDTMQFRILKGGLLMLETVNNPGAIVDLPYEWVEEEEGEG